MIKVLASLFLIFPGLVFAAIPSKAPAISPDGTVTFTLAMPNAQKVELRLEGQKDRIAMKKSKAGTWSVSVPKLPPQYYGYGFNVDGTSVLDPENVSITPNYFGLSNIFLVPGQPAKFWEAADVPHGAVHHHYYKSKIVSISSDYYVYTPPGFDARKNRKYPVLYLFHGFSDDASAWTAVGKANIILDNLIAQGKAKPMIVVMPLGYGDMEVLANGWKGPDDKTLWTRNTTKFSDALLKEVIPQVTHQYPISSKRIDHAIAGLSMGGGESLVVGLNNTKYFAYVGSFSGAVNTDVNYLDLLPEMSPRNVATINKNLRLLWIACGTEDFLTEKNKKFAEWLREQGLKHTEINTPGMHTWMVWRDNLVNFAQLLF